MGNDDGINSDELRGFNCPFDVNRKMVLTIKKLNIFSSYMENSRSEEGRPDKRLKTHM